MKIGIGKIGKSCKFNRRSWAGGGGDCEAPKLVELLAKHNPDNTYYLIGKSDFSRLSEEIKTELFPNDNVIDLYEGLSSVYEDNIGPFIDRVKETNLDHNVIMLGPHGSTNIPEYSLDKKKKYFLKTLDFVKNYAAGLFKIFNETNIPTSYILVDPRYRLRARDLILSQWPKEYLSQYVDRYKSNCIGVEEDRLKYRTKTSIVKSKYSGTESIFLYGMKKFNMDDFEEAYARKENVFRIVLNQGLGTGGLDRYPLLMKYIGKPGTDKYIKSVEIYGKWDEKIIESDSRFKGSKKYDELTELMSNCKVTLAIPIKKGWATSKYIETMNGWDNDAKDLGMITFFSPEYDSQCHVLPNDHFLRITPMSFNTKLAKVLTDDEFCKKIYKEQYDILKEDYYSGKFFNDVITKEINKCQQK